MQTISLLIKLAILLALVFFGVLNTTNVDVVYFYGKPPVSLPLFVVMVASLFLGILISLLISLKDKFKLKNEITQLIKQIAANEAEIKKQSGAVISTAAATGDSCKACIGTITIHSKGGAQPDKKQKRQRQEPKQTLF